MANILENQMQLNLNNISLREQVLSMVRDLPEAGAGGGQYVWKKYGYTNIGNPVIKVSSPSDTTLTVSSDDVDLSLATDEFFDGFVFSSDPTTYYFTYENNKLYFFSDISVSNVEVKYSANSQSFTSVQANGYYAKDDSEFSYTGNKTIREYVGYVVSDNPNEYPDGGDKDGYWYERVSEGVGGIDYGEVTYTSNQASITVTHSLGVIPSYVALLPKASIQMSSSLQILEIESDTVMYQQPTSGANVYGVSVIYGGSYNSISTNSITSTDNTKTPTQITFNKSVGSYFGSGTYYWFAIA